MLHKLNVRINKKLFRYLSYDILIVCSMLVLFGALNIYSDTKTKSGTYYFKLQMSWLVIGLLVVGFIILIDYMVIANYAPLIYWSSIILLIMNEFIGSTVNGANGWISIGSRAIQPAEFAKLALIIMLAKKLHDMEGKINNLKNFLVVCFYAFIPMAIILKQPDMGMTMVCFFTVLGIVFIAGLDLRVIVGGLTGVIGLIVVIWNSPLMKPYWKGRLVAFINPEAYSKDYSFQLKQSLIGIGSGGASGLGYGNGSQYMFVPESHTDFIFAVIGEEWGLMGAIFILLLYGYLIVRFIYISKESKDIFGKIICIGITSSFLFSIFQNMGMTIGLMPITGITLPLLSYGGSSMLTNFIGIGLILNIGMRRKKINF